MNKLARNLSAFAISLSLVTGFCSPASAYPVGTNPQLLVSQSSQLQPGQTIQVQGINLAQGCVASYFLGSSQSTAGAAFIGSSSVGGSLSTAITPVKLPAVSGMYFVILDVTGCRSNSDNALLTQQVTVGGSYSSKVSFWNSPRFASAKPTFYAHGHIQFSQVGLGGISVKAVVRDASGFVAYSKKLTTDSNGSVRLSFQLGKALKGKYSIKLTFLPKGSFSGSSAVDTTAPLK